MVERGGATSGYVLGVDLGTTYSAAAIARGDKVEPCVLGTISAQIPSVVVHRDDGEILTGEAAERRAASEPTRTAREFKRRLGDPVPIIVGGTPYGPEALIAELLAAIVRQVTEREGSPPSTIVLTHPANYTEYKLGLLRESARLAGLNLEDVRLIAEPAAAAVAYARSQRIEPGETIAIYDFGGGTFDAAVVRDTPEGFELIGTPEGMERLGGIDFDQAVLAHVDTVLGGLVSEADSSDAQVLAGQTRLRDECRRAKETLSSDTDATIPVSIPGVHADVRLTRDELEQMVRPRIVETVKALQRTIASAGIEPDDISRVLLVGGSSRMPIVAQIVREMIGRPVTMDADPKMAIAVGAALSAHPIALATSPNVPRMPRPPAPPPAGTVEPATSHAAAPSGSSAANTRRRLILGLAVAAAVGVTAFVLLRDGGDSTSSLPTTTPTGSVDSTVDPGTTTGATTGPTTNPTTGPTTTAPPTDLPLDVVERLAFDGTQSGAGIPGTALEAGVPTAINAVATASNGDVYVTAGSVVLKVADGQVTLEGQLSAGQSPATGIAVGSDGAALVATPAGVVRISDGTPELILDGPASGLSANLGPLALDGGGNLYIADNGSARIIRRAADGSLTLVAGTGVAAAAGSIPEEGVAAVTSNIGVVTGLVVDRAGNLLIADSVLGRIRAVAGSGSITTVAGGGALAVDANLPSGAVGTGLSFASITGLAVDRQRTIFVTNAQSSAIVSIAADGAASIAIGDAGAQPAAGLAIDAGGALIFSDGLVLWSIAGVAQPT